VNLLQLGTCGLPRCHHGDPVLGPLADNGGHTLTHALFDSSPAIDAGDRSICAAAPVNNLDQPGQPRPPDANGDGTRRATSAPSSGRWSSPSPDFSRRSIRCR
jgi:hypothetical protein